jgi:hypothetical protein
MPNEAEILNQAIKWTEEAVKKVPLHSPKRAEYLTRLGVRLLRFGGTNRSEGFDRVILGSGFF